MSRIFIHGNKICLEGYFLKTGDQAPNFILVNDALETITLEHFKDKKKLLMTLPSVDTPICEEIVKQINELAKKNPENPILIVTKDTPFALSRFYQQENLDRILLLSDCRHRSNFSKDYGVLVGDGHLEGLLANAIMVLDESDKVIYSELVEEITNSPNFDLAFEKLKAT